MKWSPADFLNGIVGLNPQEVAVYVVVINLIYDSGGPIKYRPEALAKRLRMQLRTLGAAINALVNDHEKLVLEDGYLTNSRASEELSERADHAEKSGENGRKSGKDRKNPENYGVKINENNGDVATKERREEEIRKNPLSPPGGVSGIAAQNVLPFAPPEPEKAAKPKRAPGVLKPSRQALFDRWYDTYPMKVAVRAAEGAFDKAMDRIEADSDDGRLAVLLTGVARYVAEIKRRSTPGDKIAHPATWLNASRWRDEYEPIKSVPKNLAEFC